MDPREPCPLRPAPGVAGVTPYHAARPEPHIDLRLDGNEGAAPPAELLRLAVELGPEVLRRYPSARELEARLAAELGVEPRQVVVTGGGDDALDRACRAALGPGRELVLPVPTFEMLERYPPLVGAAVVPVSWPAGPFPAEAVLAAAGPRTGAVAIVSPNNPTGAVATAADLERLAAALPQVLLIVDLAYVEFADEDLTAVALGLRNAVVVRTLSKAWGLAGLRVGYAVAAAPVCDWLRAAGNPYPTSGLSLALAARRLETGRAQMRALAARVREERQVLGAQLAACGARPLPSQANFVLARFRAAERVRAALARAGIAVRAFPGRPGLEDCLRITCPGEPAALERLCAALGEVRRVDPEAF